jgi:hypothetical protein
MSYSLLQLSWVNAMTFLFARIRQGVKKNVTASELARGLLTTLCQEHVSMSIAAVFFGVD